MVHKYKDPKSGTIKNLTTDEHDEFDCLIEAIYKEDTESVIDIIESTPIVVHALSEETGNMALGFAVRHLNANGLIYTELLLRNGADVFLKNKKGFSALDDIKAINGPYRQKFLDLAYKYAKTFDERMEIDPLRNISGYTEERKEDIETVNRIIDKKKAKSDKCTICKVDKIIYDNELLNHPKVQQIMEVANSQKVVDQLLDLTKDKEVASALTSAIDERYEEAISTLLADGADAETVELISDAIYSMKIEEVLGTMFVKSESEEVVPSIDSVGTLITAVEVEQLQSNPRSLFGYVSEAVETMSKYLNALLEQNINGKHLEDGIKVLEMLLYFAQMSGGVAYVGVYHGHNDDDFNGGNGGGDSGIEFDSFASHPISSDEQIIALPFNITTGSFANYAIDAI